jgi:ABC-type uncharacterized transport system permease subunit
MKSELLFLRDLMMLNLASAMEYRASFISQIAGMFLNNGIYFVFWLIFFDKFGTVRGYQIDDIYLLFAIVALGYGLAYMFAANTGPNLAYLIAQGRLDYYLVLPRRLLPHTLFSGGARLLLFTLLPAGFIGPVPVEVVKGRDLTLLAVLLSAAIVSWGVATAVFYLGLRRYESGSALNVNV